MANIKKRLATKKAQKYLNEELQNYILSFGNTSKADVIFNYCIQIKKVKQNKDIPNEQVINLIKERQQFIDSIHPQNTLKNIELDVYVWTQLFELSSAISSEDLKRISNQALFIESEDFDFMSAFYRAVKLVRYGLCDENIHLILIDSERDHVSCIWLSLWEIFFHKDRFYKGKKISDEYYRKIAQSKLFKEILANRQSIDLAWACDNNQNPMTFLKICETLSIDELLHNDGKIFIEYNDAHYFSNIFYEYIEQLKTNIKDYEVNEGIYSYKERCHVSFGFGCTFEITDIHTRDVDTIGDDITFNKIPFYSVVMTNGEATSLKITRYNRTRIKNKSGYFETSGEHEEFSYSFYSYRMKEIFVRKNRQKSRPAVLNDLVHATYDIPEMQELIRNLMDTIAKEHPFFKNVKELYNIALQCPESTFPFTLNDAFTYTNWNLYFKSKYKIASTLPINYNRITPFAAYAIILCYKYINPSDINILITSVGEHPEIIPSSHFRMKKIYKVEQLIENYYTIRLLELKEANIDKTTVKDWIHMLILLKKPISLRKTNMRKITEAHDKLMLKKFMEECKNEEDYLLIPDNTKFKELRNILPSSYEWIKTKRRLLFETYIQNHCVWSYEDRIKYDYCAIYSIVLPETGHRHTIEFVYKDNSYKVNQIQKSYDRGYDEEIITDLKKYLGENISA